MEKESDLFFRFVTFVEKNLMYCESRDDRYQLIIIILKQVNASHVIVVTHFNLLVFFSRC